MRSLLLSSLFAALGATVALPCPYMIRDSGYIVREPKTFKVHVFVDAETAQRQSVPGWIESAADAELKNANVGVKLVDLSDSTAEGASYWKRAGSPRPPAAVLVSPRDDVLRLYGIGRGKLTEASLRQVLRQVATSPARRKLTANLVHPWCVILLAKGTDAAANAAAEKAVNAAAAEVKGILKEAKETRFRPAAVITLSRSDASERIFLWSLGLLDGNKAEPRTAVVWGRGRRLGPVLKGETLTEESVSHLLWFLGQNCTCTSDPTRLLGPVAPLVWPRSLEAQVADVLGFDPKSPKVYATLSGVWSTLSESPAQEKPAAEADLGFIEFDDEPAEKGPVPQPAVAEGMPTPSPATEPGVIQTPTSPTPTQETARPPKQPTPGGKGKPPAAAGAETREDASPSATPPPRQTPPAEGPENGEPQPPDEPGATPAGAPGGEKEATPRLVEPPPEATPPTGTTEGAAGDDSSLVPSPQRFRATRPPAQPTFGSHTARLIGVFGLALVLLAVGGGTALVLHRRKYL